jgi:transglutaminase-like putative cysteine protease
VTRTDAVLVALRGVLLPAVAVAGAASFASGGVLVVVAAAALGAVFGGRALARSSLRTPWLAGLALTLGGLLMLLGAALTSTTIFADLLGTTAVIATSSALRVGGLALGVGMALRAMAGRGRLGIVVELGVWIAVVAAVFAGHRHGMIARPLWFSDWAWRNGWDPGVALTILGGAMAVTMATLLVLEQRRGLSLASIAAMPILALLVFMSVRTQGLPRPEPANDLGLTESTSGDEPLPTPPGPAPGGGEQTPGDQGGGGEEQQPQLPGGPGGELPQGGGGAGEQGDDSGGDPLDGQSGGDNGPPEPMAVVVLGDDYEPPMQSFYIRQDAWSLLNGVRLVPSPRQSDDGDLQAQFPVRREEVREPPPTTNRVRIEGSVALLTDHARPMALESALSFTPAINPNPERFVRAWRFESLALNVDYAAFSGAILGDPAWTEQERAHYLEAPADPRYAELAQTIIATLPAEVRGDRWAQALAIKLWLDRSVTYSLRHRHEGDADPTAAFLFGDLTGYCVHIAHAAVYMYRTLGIPSRIGVGYMVPGDHRRGSTLLVMENDAHAWPEIYVGSTGWVVLDVQPQNYDGDPLPPLNEDLADLLGEMAREAPPASLDEAIDEQRRENGWIPPSTLAAIVALGILLGLYGTKAYRRVAPRFADERALARIAYRASLDLLGESGLRRAHGETREAFARRVAEHVPAFREITELHVADAFGASGDASGRERWALRLADVRRQTRAAAPWWRRLLGLLDPTSFLRTT